MVFCRRRRETVKGLTTTVTSPTWHYRSFGTVSQHTWIYVGQVAGAVVGSRYWMSNGNAATMQGIRKCWFTAVPDIDAKMTLVLLGVFVRGSGGRSMDKRSSNKLGFVVLRVSLVVFIPRTKFHRWQRYLLCKKLMIPYNMHSILQTNIRVRICCGIRLNMYLRIIPTYQPSVNPRNSLFRGMVVFPRNVHVAHNLYQLPVIFFSVGVLR